MRIVLDYFDAMLSGIFGKRCTPKKSLKAEGYLFGRPFAATLDDPLAVHLLTHADHKEVIDLFSKYSAMPLDTTTLIEIAQNYSMDVATLYFLQRAYYLPQNNLAQKQYLAYLDKLKTKNANDLVTPLKDFYVVFVPGLNYHDTSNGGDFAKQRKLLLDFGVKNELIQTGNWGFTNVNAEIIAGRLKELSQQYENIIVVSASKGGLETAITLGRLLKPEEIKPVKAWVSVGGILKGSPVADKYLTWPKCWIAEIGLLFVRQNINLVRDVSYSKRQKDFSSLKFPEHIKRIHFVGAPLSTQIHKRIKSTYCSIKGFGPNDGITPIADETTEDGIIVSELGFDHYYQHPEIDKKTIALALTVIHN